MRKAINEGAVYYWETGCEVLALWPDGTFTFEIEPHRIDGEFAEKWAKNYGFEISPEQVRESLKSKTPPVVSNF